MRSAPMMRMSAMIACTTGYDLRLSEIPAIEMKGEITASARHADGGTRMP